MKLFVWLLFLLLVCSVEAATVTGSVQTVTSSPYDDDNILFIPKSTPWPNGNNIVQSVTVRSASSNLNFSANLLGGVYLTKFTSGDQIYIYVPINDTNTYSFTFLSTNLLTMALINNPRVISSLVLSGAGGITIVTNNPGTSSETITIYGTNLVAAATNAIANNNGSGTNTTFYGIASGNAGGMTNISNIGGTNLLQTITPEMFGCKGDGVTDDTLNFQKFINAVRNFIIAGLNVEGHCVPSVSYLISSQITNCCPINLKGKAVQWRAGAGQQATTLLLSGAGSGLVSTNTGQNTGFKLEDFSESSTGSSKGIVGILLTSSGGLGNQAVDIKNYTAYNLDKGIIMTNCDEININEAVFFNCTNGIISEGTGGAAVQANRIANMRANCYGLTLYLGGGQYSVEHLDTSPLANVNNVYIHNATVSLKNCNIENVHMTAPNYNVISDNGNITAEGGTWLLPNTCIGVQLINNGTVHFNSFIQCSADVSGTGYSISDSNNTATSSTEIGQFAGGLRVTNANVGTYAFDSSKLVYNLGPIPVDFTSGTNGATGAGMLDTLKIDESNSHNFWNGIDFGFVYNGTAFWEDLSEFNRCFKHTFGAFYPSVNLTTSTLNCYNNAVSANTISNWFLFPRNSGFIVGADADRTKPQIFGTGNELAFTSSTLNDTFLWQNGSFAQEMLLSGNVLTVNVGSIKTNNAAVATIANPLTSGTAYVNGAYRALLTVNCQSVVPSGGATLAWLTNATSTENLIFSNMFGTITTGAYTNINTATMILAPSDTVTFTNKSLGTTNITLISSFIHIL